MATIVSVQSVSFFRSSDNTTTHFSPSTSFEFSPPKRWTFTDNINGYTLFFALLPDTVPTPARIAISITAVVNVPNQVSISFFDNFVTIEETPLGNNVPEPAAIALLMAGLAGFGVARKKHLSAK